MCLVWSRAWIIYSIPKSAIKMDINIKIKTFLNSSTLASISTELRCRVTAFGYWFQISFNQSSLHVFQYLYNCIFPHFFCLDTLFSLVLCDSVFSWCLGASLSTVFLVSSVSSLSLNSSWAYLCFAYLLLLSYSFSPIFPAHSRLPSLSSDPCISPRFKAVQPSSQMFFQHVKLGEGKTRAFGASQICQGSFFSLLLRASLARRMRRCAQWARLSPFPK